MSSTSESPSPSHYFDNMLRAYEEDIKREHRLINEVRYYLTKSSAFVSVGLSPARGFIPVVKLMHRRNCITFTHHEWIDFLTEQFHNIQEHLKKKRVGVNEGNEEDVCVTCGIFQVQFVVSSRKVFSSIVKIRARDVEINLDRKCVSVLSQVLDVVENRIQRLTLMNFPEYYNALLELCARERNCEETAEAYIRRYIKYQESSECGEYTEQGECLLEILAFELDRFKNDIGMFIVASS